MTINILNYNKKKLNKERPKEFELLKKDDMVKYFQTYDFSFENVLKEKAKNTYYKVLYPALFDTDYNKYHKNCHFNPYRKYPYTNYKNTPFYFRFNEWRDKKYDALRKKGFDRTKYQRYKNKYRELRFKYDKNYYNERKKEFFEYKKQKRLGYERALKYPIQKRSRQLFDPVLNLSQYIINRMKITKKKSFFHKKHTLGHFLYRNIFTKFKMINELLYYYYYSKYILKDIYKDNYIKKKLSRWNKKKLFFYDNTSYHFNLFFPKKIKSFYMNQKEQFKKVMFKNPFFFVFDKLSDYKRFKFFYKFEKKKMDVLSNFIWVQKDLKTNETFFIKKMKKEFFQFFFSHFYKYQFQLFFYRRHFNSYVYYNWMNKYLFRRKKKWIKKNIKYAKRGKYWFSFKKYWRKLFYNPVFFKHLYKRTQTHQINHEKLKYSLSWIVKKRLIYKKKGRIRFWRFRKKFFYKNNNASIGSFWKTSVFFFKSRRRYFYHLEHIKKFYDCFYIINRFINWYQPQSNKYNLVYMYFQYKKYTRFTNLYNSFFEQNYKNILSILNCYNKKTFHTNSKLKQFLFRKKRLFKLNFFYRLFLNKKKLRYYNYFFNKTLYDFKKSSFYNDKNYMNTSYVNDVSILFNDHIMNWNYIYKVDEKMHFYLKHLFFNKLLKKMHFKKLTNERAFKFTHLLNFQEQYLTHYKKLYTCTGISLYVNSNKNQLIFYSYLLIKFNVFIFKNTWFSFFKEYIVHRLKSKIYHYKLNKPLFKKGVQLKNKPVEISWLNLFTFPIKSFDDYEYYGKKEMYLFIHYISLSDLNSFFKMNTFDWYYFLSNVLKTKKKNKLFDKRNYYFQYKKKWNDLKKKYLKKFIDQLFFNSSYIKVNFEHLNNTLKKRYQPFYGDKVFFNKKEKFDYIKTYKLNLYNAFKRRFFYNNDPISKYNTKWKMKSHIIKKRNKIIKNKKVEFLYENNKDQFFYDKFISFYNKFVNNNKYNNSYFFRKYYEIYTDINHIENTKLKKKKKNYIQLWNSFLKNKKIIIYFIIWCVKYLYRFKNDTNNMNWYQFESFIKYYYLIRFLKWKEKHYNFFFSIHNNNKKNNFNNKKRVLFDTKKSFVVTKKRKHFFILSNFYNIFMFFFLFFKKTVIEQVINNSFIVYNNKIIFYNIKNNFIFLKNKFYQFDYLINNFLNEEIESLIK